MYTYYLCGDNDTIQKIKFFLKPEDKPKYLALLENFLTELVFVEKNSEKKLVNKEDIAKENNEKITMESGDIALQKKQVIEVEELGDNLPFLVTIKKQRYHFLRPWTIWFLIRLLGKDLDKGTSPYIEVLSKEFDRSDYLDFNELFSTFFDDQGMLTPKRAYDYEALTSLLNAIDNMVINKYSKAYLDNFWQGDDADRAVAEGIASDAVEGRKGLSRLRRYSNKPLLF